MGLTGGLQRRMGGHRFLSPFLLRLPSADQVSMRKPSNEVVRTGKRKRKARKHISEVKKIDLKSQRSIAKTTKRKKRKRKLKANQMIKEKRKHIPEDILLNNLLPFLPAKSLFRFKSVCRRWNSLVSGSTSFAWDQCRSYACPSGLFYNEHRCRPWEHGFIPISPSSVGVPDPTLSFARRRLVVLASSNGLLLCRPSYGRYVVCNPATKEWTALRWKAAHSQIGFAFDPSASPPGFTIVCIVLLWQWEAILGDHGAGEVECRFHVYSSSTGWREPSGRAVVPSAKWYGDSLFAGGQIHWRVNTTVLSFNPNTDVPHVTPLPELSTGARHYCRLGEMRGRLSCINIVDRAQLEVWVMEAASWAKVYSVPLTRIFRKNLGVLESSSGCEEEEEKKTTLPGGDVEGNAKPDGKEVKSKIRALVRTCPIKPLPSMGDDILFLWMRRRVFSFHLPTTRLTELYLSQNRAKIRFFPYINNLAPLREISDAPGLERTELMP